MGRREGWNDNVPRFEPIPIYALLLLLDILEVDQEVTVRDQTSVKSEVKVARHDRSADRDEDDADQQCRRVKGRTSEDK